MFRIIIKIIIEILIAVGLFIVLVRYTPLFDKILESENKTDRQQSIDITNILQDKSHGMAADIDNIFVQKIQKQLELQKNPKNNLYELKSNNDGTSLNTTNLNNIKKKQDGLKTESDSFFEDTNKKRKSCELPWSNDKVEDGMHIIAYQEPHSNNENICVGEIRLCENGHLLGGYQYNNCTYTIDGVNNGEEKIKGATQTNHTLFTFIKGSERKKEFLQPDRYDYPNKKKPNYTYNLDGHRVTALKNEGSTSWKNGDNNTKSYEIEEIVGELGNASLKNCYDWNGRFVKQGDYVIAYKSSRELAPNICIFQKRFCNNGVLEGNRENEDCTQYKKTNKETETFIKYKSDGRILNVSRSNILGETIEPYPVKKPEIGNIETLDNNEPEEKTEPCVGECRITDIKEIKFEEVCKKQYVKITNAYPKNVCLDRSCYELTNKLVLELKSSSVNTGIIEFVFLGNDNKILGTQKKEIGLNEGNSNFEYGILNGTKIIDLKVEYKNLCRNNIVEKKISLDNGNKEKKVTCKRLGETRPLNTMVEGRDIPCCEGLTFITTASDPKIVGAGQVCAKVGDKICDERYENNYNSKDCIGKSFE